MQIKLRAKDAFEYDRKDLRAGDLFDATENDSTALILLGRAELAPERTSEGRYKGSVGPAGPKPVQPIAEPPKPTQLPAERPPTVPPDMPTQLPAEPPPVPTQLPAEPPPDPTQLPAEPPPVPTQLPADRPERGPRPTQLPTDPERGPKPTQLPADPPRKGKKRRYKRRDLRSEE